VASGKTGIPAFMANGLAAAAQILASAHRDEASGLLHELADGPARYQVVAANVTEWVRCALALSQPELAARLAGAVEPRTPLDHHSDIACRAQLANSPTPSSLMAGAWRRSVPAMRKSRCARRSELFASMGYKPALAETDALLERTTAAAS
jgi:hypothetical protein